MGINFPASPALNQKYPQPAVAGIPVYTWDGEKWTTVGGSIAAYAPPADAVPLMNATPGLVGTSTDYAREDHVHPTDTTFFASEMAYSGMQINGAMDVSQEKGTAATQDGSYVLDGFVLAPPAGTAVVSATQNPNTTIVPGFSNWLFNQVATAQPTMGANDSYVFIQYIEGYRIARLGWGTANAQPLTLAFWTAHQRTGVFGGSIRNLAFDRCYPFAYTQNAANVAQYNVITVPGETSGAWTNANGVGLRLTFAIACGATQTAPSSGSWLTSSFLAPPGQVNGVATTGDIFRLTGVTVLPGTQAPTAAQSPNIMRPYDQELVTCMRYFWKCVNEPLGWAWATNISSGLLQFRPPMRVAPTLLNASFSPTGTVASAGATSTSIPLYNSGAAWAVNSQISVSASFDARL